MPDSDANVSNDETSNVVDLKAVQGGQSEKKSVATQLVELALRKYRLGRTPDDRLFAYGEGSHVVRMFRGGHISMRSELAGMFYERNRKTASDNALKEALNVLEYKASRMEPTEVYLRSAMHGGELWIDLGDESERVVHVTPTGGYEVVDSGVPVFFERTMLTVALPEPVAGGDLEQLWDYVNVQGADRELIYGWQVAALVLVNSPCPALGLLGEQGTAKTSATRTLVSMVDPSAAPVRKRPKDEEAWVHALNGSRCVAFDNLSNMPPWLSDSICRAVTGDADVNRKYYTDDNIRVLKYRRVVVFNGIDVGVPRGDLAERTIWGELETIPKTERKSERALEAAWTEAHPLLFGALLDLVSMVLAKLPDIDLDEAPRMADFAEVLAAMDAATDFTSLEHYMGAQESSSHDIVEGDKFLSQLTWFVGQQDDRTWEGTSKDLYALMPAPELGHQNHDKFWPTSGHGYTNKLKRSAPALRAVGWVVEQTPGNRNQAATWRLVSPTPDDSATAEQSSKSQTTAETYVNTKYPVKPQSSTAGYPHNGSHIPFTENPFDHTAAPRTEPGITYQA